MTPTSVSELVEAEGHLIDSQLLNAMFDNNDGVSLVEQARDQLFQFLNSACIEVGEWLIE